MGKFFKGRVKKDRTSLIKAIIIGIGIFFIIILFILIAAKAAKNRRRTTDNVVLEPKDSVTIEVNSELPQTEDLFKPIKNFDVNLINVNYNNLNISKVGQYIVTVSAENRGSANVIVYVVDSAAPELVLKNVEIEYGEDYNIQDFVESCTDNSKGECIYSYYDKSQDQTGKIIDYSSFTEEGTYVVKIVAKDASNNVSHVKEAQLTIGHNYNDQPINNDVCYYGDLTVNPDRVSYPIAVIVGDQNANCALDRNLWDDAKTKEPVSKFYQDDLRSLTADVEAYLNKNSLYPEGAKIDAYRTDVAVLNDEIKGLVGYGIYVKVYVVSNNYTGDIRKDDNLVLAYFIRADHTREYKVNKYNLK